jgi:hypothetical protein
MIRGDRRQDLQSRRQQFQETPEDHAEALADRKILSVVGGLIGVGLLALLIRWLWP